MIEIGFPSHEDELAILQYNIDFAPEDLLDLTCGFLQEAHRFRLNYSTRDGVNIMRYAIKLQHSGLSQDPADAFHRAVEQILGPDAEDFEARARGQFMLGNVQDFSGFFTTPEDLGEDER